MKRYFIRFSYLGKQYRGLQKNVVTDDHIMVHDTDTIQGTLESAFSTLIPKCMVRPRFYSSSRTDTGVHALCNAAHIDIENKYDAIYNPDNVLKAINRYLIKCNHDIRLLEFVPVKLDFHARHFVQSRTYMYRFMIAKKKNEQRIPVIEASQCYHLRSETFDLERLKAGTKLFMGTKNFQTFSAKKISNRPINFTRTLNSLTIEEGQSLMPYDTLSQNFDFWNVVCSSHSFLYKQVRRMVGTLLALATGKITEKDITIMLQVPGHHNWLTQIHPVPGFGLYLVNVEYCQNQVDKYCIKYKTCPNRQFIVIPEDEN
ncbi:tRNA pseudouridine synthase-like 1 isoform X1 [Osmia bicornis bicornis]|uniref:tRNA pseudouridine synthase-like 1 isoform X1 n=2 Tax=Osmia bicornis bicornis TaxID=1437191 RepID=UPI001EAE88D5|nr:tRNA pseudouridine synthase-like 1 isoform X1 [Osmia bicornis bicornis]